MSKKLVTFNEWAVVELRGPLVNVPSGGRTGVGLNFGCAYSPDTVCVEPNVGCGPGSESNTKCVGPNASCQYEELSNDTCVAPNVSCNI